MTSLFQTSYPSFRRCGYTTPKKKNQPWTPLSSSPAPRGLPVSLAPSSPSSVVSFSSYASMISGPGCLDGFERLSHLNSAPASPEARTPRQYGKTAGRSPGARGRHNWRRLRHRRPLAVHGGCTSLRRIFAKGKRIPCRQHDEGEEHCFPAIVE